MGFGLVSKSMTLNDLERRNGRYFALFQRIFMYDVAVKQLLGLHRFQILSSYKSSRSLSHLLMSDEFLFSVSYRALG